MRRAALLAIALCAAILTPIAARADAPPLVTVVRPSGPDARLDELITRLSAELRAAGFEAHVVTTEGVPAEARAVATIALSSTEQGPGVEVRVADRRKQVDPGDAGTETAASDLAIRSVELLRANLLEQRARPDPPRADAPAPRAMKAKPLLRSSASAPRREAAPPIAGTLEAGLGLLAGGSLGIAPAPLLRVAAGRAAGLSLRVTLVPALVATTVRASQGVLSLRQTLGTLDLGYTFLPESALLAPRLSLGAGIYQLKLAGHAAPPYRSEHSELLAASFVAGAGLGLRLGAGLTVTAALEAMALAPRPAVAVLDQEVARAGLVTFLPSLGLAARF